MASFERRQWKPGNTGQNDPTTEPAFSMELLDEKQLAAFDIARCMDEALRHDPRTAQQIGKVIGTSKGYMSKWLNSVGAEQLGRFAKFCQATGHIAPVQKIVHDLGFEIRPRRGIKCPAARTRPVRGRA